MRPHNEPPQREHRGLLLKAKLCTPLMTGPYHHVPMAHLFLEQSTSHVVGGSTCCDNLQATSLSSSGDSLAIPSQVVSLE